MRLIIHAGLHKTATTTFQEICFKNIDLLYKDGICYPRFLGQKNHSCAAWLLQERDTQGLNHFLDESFKQAKNNSCNTILLSGEDFENCLVDTHLAKMFECLLKNFGIEDISWFITRRKPFDYLKSIYSEMAMYGMVLDLKLLANLAIKYGYVSPGGRKYNYKFVFDIYKFSNIFKKEVNENLEIIEFENFIKDFAGRFLIENFISEKRISILCKSALEIGILKKKAPEENIEFRYFANFLGIEKDKYDSFYKENKSLVNGIISNRIKRNRILEKEIELAFKKRFIL